MKIVYYFLLPVLLLACNSKDTRKPGSLPVNSRHETTVETGINILEPNWAYRFDPKDRAWIADVGKRDYLVLYGENGKYKLIPATINLKYDIDECTNDSLVLFVPSVADNASLLLSGLPRHNKGQIKAKLYEDTYIDPSSPFTFEHNNTQYTLAARADTTGYNDNTGDWEALRDYRLFFSDGKTEQLLVTIEQFEGTMLQALFIGDIDGDNRPDILINATGNAEFRNIVLFLSSLAKNGELVHLSATDSRWFDC